MYQTSRVSIATQVILIEYVLDNQMQFVECISNLLILNTIFHWMIQDIIKYISTF